MSTPTDRHHGPPGGLLFTPATAPFPLPRRPLPAAPVRGPGPGWVQVGPAGRDVDEIERGFAAAWRDAPWPARPWQILAAADAGGVDLRTRVALLELPARTYRSPREVAAVLARLPPAHARRRD
ncbi:DUF2795 domain-containing protein [Actinomycetospora soli]|uniref:DUF2795 domain-containing protein n=1 Tax=Actinomycetospora soli TaxID=2893887 RepID=UPI001E4E6655|nr:DUF2795 domain-containing protein [Actinomycetospora soli]MCD2190149.1 DUF2795 domain-containing protein [Actinomycetospora soli]